MKAHLCLLSLLALLVSSAFGADVSIKDRPVHPTRLIAKLASAVSADAAEAEVAALAATQGLEAIQEFNLVPGLVVLDVASTSTFATAAAGTPPAPDAEKRMEARLDALRASGRFEFVEPDYVLTAMATPGDAMFADGTLWGLSNTGQNGGVAGADIDAVRAWNITTGSSGVVVAIVDTGISSAHEELASRLWRNPGEIADNGLDDDGNGYVDDVFGIDAITQSGNPVDDNGHGTHVAGTIGAAANNGSPLVGVAWDVRMMACKFLNASGSGYTSDAIQCIDYAVTNGARVLNASWGGRSHDQALSEAIAAANAHGVLFVAAAGNSAADTDVLPFYPSGYGLPNIISVAAIDARDQLAGFSNYGATSVDLGAPGVGIMSSLATDNGAYGSRSGTSMAAPHVSGVAALILSRYPGATLTELRARLVETTVPTAALNGKVVSGGRVNAFQALSAAEDGVLDLAFVPGAGSKLVGGRSSIVTVRVSDLGAVTNATVSGSAAGSSPAVFLDTGVSPDVLADDGTYTASFTPPAVAGARDFSVTASAPGKTAATVVVSYAVVLPPENDSFATRSVLTGATATASLDTFGATRETGEPNHAERPGGKSVWWQWTAPFSGSVTVATTGSDFDTLLGLYTGTEVASLTSVASNDDAGFGATSALTFNAVAGTTYALAVDGYNGAGGNAVLDLTLVATPPAPANDNFANRIVITGNSAVVTGSTVSATREPSEPNHVGFADGGKSVWWTWTAPAAGIVFIDTNRSAFDTTLAVYTGSNFATFLAEAVDDDSGLGHASRVGFYATSGTSYHLAVDGRNGASGAVALALELAPAPDNDHFANATPLAGASAHVTGSNVNATRENNEPPHGESGVGASVWWRWAAPSTGEVTITTAGSSFDTVLGVYFGDSLYSLSRVIYNDNDPAGGAASRVSFTALAGTTYRIAVDSAWSDRRLDTGSIVLDLAPATPGPAPANDAFANRTALSGSSLAVSASNVGASREVGEPYHANVYGGRSLWWTWTAPTHGRVTITTVGSAIKTALAVYTGGSLASLTPKAAAVQDQPGTLPSAVTFDITSGTQYLIAVDGVNGAMGAIALGLTVVPPPVNDNFANRSVLTGRSLSVQASNVGATREDEEPRHFSYSDSGHSVWWTWTAPASGEAAISTEGSAFSAGVAVYTGNFLPSLTAIASSFASGENTRTSFYAVAGTSYQIAVDGSNYSSTTGSIRLTLELGRPVSNDLFADRAILSGSAARITASNVGATQEPGESDYNYTGTSARRSVWWTWTAPTTCAATISLAGSSFDTLLVVHTGNTLGSLVVVASNDNDFLGRPTSALTFAADAGTTYQIVVAGKQAAVGTIELSLTTASRPANDNFSASLLLSGSTVSATGSNVGATREVNEPSWDYSGTPATSVWWRWTPTANGEVTITTRGSTFDTVLSVYAGSALGSLTSIASNDNDVFGGRSSRVTFGAVADTTYQIRVGGTGAAAGTIALDLSATATPANDLFANRRAVGDQPIALSSWGAGKETGEPNHAGFAGGSSLWFTWTAPSTRSVSFATTGSAFDTVIAVYTGGSVAALTPVASNADEVDLATSRAAFVAQAGVAYQIAVDSQTYSGSAPMGGLVVLSHSQMAAPANDMFASRTILTGESFAATGTTIGATRETGESSHNSYPAADASVWWSWTAPRGRTVELTTLGSTFDTVLAVYTGSAVNALTLVASNDNASDGSVASKLTFDAAAGVTYQIVVAAKTTGSGLVALNLASLPVPANDFFANATVLTAWSGTHFGSNVGATTEAGEPGFGTTPARHSVWWKWTAASDVEATIDATASSFTTLLGVYTGAAANALTPVARSLDYSSDRLSFRAVAGTTYTLAIDGVSSTAGAIAFTLSERPAVSNDRFADRITISGTSATVTGSNVGATVELGEGQGGYYDPRSFRTVWWTWTAPGNGFLTLSTQGSQLDTFLQVFTGSAIGSLSLVAANDNDPAGLRTSRLGIEVTAGTSYQFSVDGVSGTEGSISLGVEFTPPPANDNFADRAPLAGDSVAVSGRTGGATAEVGEPTHGSIAARRSVWWSWTAPRTATVVLTAYADGETLNLGVHTGSAVGSLATVLTSGGAGSLAFPATAGTTYHIAVDSNAGSAPAFVLRLELADPPANDHFVNRITVSGVSFRTTGNNAHATRESGEPSLYYSGQGRTVWWTWTAPANGRVNLSTVGSEIASIIDVYSGAALSSLITVNNGYGGNALFVATAGTTYQFRVDSASGSGGAVSLSLAMDLAPAHDSFANRAVLAGTSASASARNAYASNEPGEPSHTTGYSYSSGSLWWTWTAPQDGLAVISTAGSTFDTVLAVYTGNTLAGLTLVAGNDNATSETNTSRVAFAAAAGTTYQIVVAGLYGGTGDIRLSLELVQPPVNDHFASRLAIAGNSTLIDGSNVAATKEAGEANHAGNAGGASVWWTWTPSISGLVTITTAGSEIDTMLGVYTGAGLDALSAIAADDDSGPGRTSAVTFAAAAGTAYQIAIDGKSGAAGALSLALSFPQSPTNDRFADRIAVTGASVVASGTNVGATRETGEPTHYYYAVGKTVWWSWTATVPSEVTLHSRGTSFDHVLAVYQGTTINALASVASAVSDAVTGQAPRLTFFALAGATYQIAVDGTNSGSGAGAIAFSLVQGTPPSNDNFENRVQLSGSSIAVAGSNRGASRQNNEPSSYYAASRSVWWTWTPPASGIARIGTGGSDFDTVLAVYTGSNLTSLVQVATNEDASNADRTSLIFVEVVAGTAYQIAVDSKQSAPGGAIQLAIDRVPAPANDNFADGAVLTGTSASGTVSNLGATREAGERSHSDNYSNAMRSVWWTWTAPTSGECTLSAERSEISCFLRAYTGSAVSALVSVTFNGETGGYRSSRSQGRFFAVAGTTYHLAVDSFALGTVVLSLNLTPAVANDQFADRIPLAGATVSATGTNRTATVEAGQPLLPGGRSVWWTWTAPGAGAVTITTFGSSFDTALGVYTGSSVSNLTILATNDDSPGGGRSSRVVFGAVAGTTYQIMVDGGETDLAGDIVLNLSTAAAPANDNFANRAEISGASDTMSGSTLGATLEAGETAAGFSPSGSIWWTWTAPSNGVAVVSTAGSVIDTILSVLTGSAVDALTLVENNDNEASTNARHSRVVFAARTGQSYQLRVAGNQGEAGPVVLSVDLLAAEANDAFADRITLAGSTATANGSNAHATREPGEPYMFQGNHSIWWTWTAPASGQTSISTAGSAYATGVGVLRGTDLGGLSSVAVGSSDPLGGNGSRATFSAVAGTAYHIMVDALGPNGGPVAVSLAMAAAPANDAFANATVFTGSSSLGTITSASLEAGEPALGGARSIWWKWTAPTDLSVTVSSAGSSFREGLGIFTGTSVSSLTTVGSAPYSYYGSTGNRLTFRATAGTMYYFAIVGDDSAAETAILSLQTATPLSNDQFADRQLIAGGTVQVTGDTTNATREAGEPAHGPGSTRSIWYSWTAPRAGPVTIATAPISGIGGASNFDTLLAVYTGSSLSPLTFVTSNDNDVLGGRTSRVSFIAVSGTTYQIAIDGANGASGFAALNLKMDPAFPAPVNDMFADRLALAGSFVTAAGSNVGSTHEALEPRHTGAVGAGSVWWKWTAPHAGPATITTYGSSYSATLAVYRGNAVGALTLVASDGSYYSYTGSRVVFDAAAGVEYQIAVDGAGTERGNIALTILGAPSVPNDAFADRIPLAGVTVASASSVIASGSNLGASKEVGEPTHAGNRGGRSVWWTWVSPGRGTATISTRGSSFDTLLAVYTGSAVAQLTAIAVNDDGVFGGSRVSFPVVTGTTYQIAVDGKDYYGNGAAVGSIALTVDFVGTIAPQITTHPQSQTVNPGASVSFSVAATGTAPLTYQWRRGGQPIAAATGSSFSIAAAQLTDGGRYDVVVSNEAGSAISEAAVLAVENPPPPGAPEITTQPQSQSVKIGAAVSFNVVASGTAPLTYQWRKNGQPIVGASATTLAFDAARLIDQASYDVVVSNLAGSIVSQPASLAVGRASRLINVSIRSRAGRDDRTLIVGLVVGGSGEKGVLIRGVGPTLADFNVPNPLPDPRLMLFSKNPEPIAENDNWGGTPELIQCFETLYAFSLPPASKDAAILTSLSPGSYTAHVVGANAETGIALVEAYDADPDETSARLVNVSARTEVGAGDDILIAGFVIDGDHPKAVLVRGIGPTLAQYDVAGVLTNPRLALYERNQLIAQNDDWGGAPELQAAFAKTYAFALPLESKDAVLVVTLPPGVYTAQVSGVGGATGVALAEVYEIPEDPAAPAANLSGRNPE